jgi:hypothetical protein
MGATSRFALRYPELTDAPDGPAALTALAADVEGWLARAFECTDATRPASPPAGMVISVTDLGTTEIRRAGAWVVIGGSGSGGYTPVEGQWYASSPQSITNNTDTTVAFGTTEKASAIVTRASTGLSGAMGAGHKFTLLETGTFAVDCTIRFTSGPTGSRFAGLYVGATSPPTSRVGAQQNDGGPAAATRSFSFTRRWAANTDLLVVCAQSSGSSLSLEPVGGSAPTDGFVRLNITKIGP